MTREDDVVAAYAAGEDPAAIEQLYGLPPGSAERIVAGKTPGAVEQQESRWSLAHTGNRVLLAVATAGLIACLCGGTDLPVQTQLAILLVVGGVTYALVTLLHRTRRR
ncbi:hypothetical protein [Micromonospora carbonacea]|uniref:hypothetical protein n=1 Tax=Micromonospora carbonacea TaxID=47853 RepID=UPI00340DC4E7